MKKQKEIFRILYTVKHLSKKNEGKGVTDVFTTIKE